MDGIRAAREISKASATLPILMHTMHSSPTLDLEAQKAGVSQVVNKCESGDKLIIVIENLLNAAHGRAVPGADIRIAELAASRWRPHPRNWKTCPAPSQTAQKNQNPIERLQRSPGGHFTVLATGAGVAALSGGITAGVVSRLRERFRLCAGSGGLLVFGCRSCLASLLENTFAVSSIALNVAVNSPVCRHPLSMDALPISVRPAKQIAGAHKTPATSFARA